MCAIDISRPIVSRAHCSLSDFHERFSYIFIIISVCMVFVFVCFCLYLLVAHSIRFDLVDASYRNGPNAKRHSIRYSWTYGV